MALCLPLRFCSHRSYWQRRCPRPGGLLPTRLALLAKRGSFVGLEVPSPLALHLRFQDRARIKTCSASSSSSASDDAPPSENIPTVPKTTNGSVRTSRGKPLVWVAIGAAIVAIGLAISGTNHMLSSSQSEASQLLVADLSTSASGSSQEAAQFTVNWFGRSISLTERSPGYMYFLLLMAAGFGLFVSEEALNVWIGGTLGRLLVWNQSRDAFTRSLSANLPYIASTVIWVYCGVCISDLVPFYAGRQAAKSGTGTLICEKLGVSQEKFDQIRANVQRHGNLIGIVERLSLGVRNPTSFLAGFVGIKPTNYFAGVCVGGLITLPLQTLPFSYSAKFPISVGMIIYTQLGIGIVLRDRPVAALAGVAVVVGIWTLLPYIAAGIGSIVFFVRRRGRKQSS